jgi:hypothetical protein
MHTVSHAPGGAVPSSPEGAERKLVRNAWLTLEVASEEAVKLTLDGARAACRKAGGYVDAERTAGMVLKVPGERLDDLLTVLERSGHVTHKEVSTRNVTGEYVDLALRISATRTFQARLLALLEKTEDVQRLLEVERELGRVNETLERLQGQMRLMDNQTTYATVDLTVEKEVRPGPVGWVFYAAFKGLKWLFVWD